MRTIQKLLEFLGSDSMDGYGLKPIPSKIDDDVRDLLSSFVGLDASSRHAILAKMTEVHGFVLCAFAQRMAAYAVRTNTVKHIINGLRALEIAFNIPVFDPREVVLVFSLLYRSVMKLGLDPRAIFANTVRIEGERFDEFVKGYLDQPEEDRTIKNMGYIESCDEDGFLYQRTW